MNRKERTSVHALLGLFMLAAMIFLSSNIYAQAQQSWNPAPDNPPSNNTPAPINIGSLLQHKQGPLRADEFHSNRYCDENGQNCISSLNTGVTGAPAASNLNECRLQYKFYRSGNENSTPWRSVLLNGESNTGPVSEWAVRRLDDECRGGCGIQMRILCPPPPPPGGWGVWATGSWSDWERYSPFFFINQCRRTRTVDCVRNGEVMDPNICRPPRPSTLDISRDLRLCPTT